MQFSSFIHYRLLLERLGIIMLLYTICRILFFVFNFEFFQDVDALAFLSYLFYGLRFDLAAIVYINALFILLHLFPFSFRSNNRYQLLLKVIFYLCNLIPLAFAIADFEYYSFTNKRTTSDVFYITKEFTGQLPQFLVNYWHLLLIFIVFIIITELLYRKTNFKKHQVISQPDNRANFKSQIIISLLFIVAFVFAARGGFQLKPLKPIDAVQYTAPPNSTVILNTPFTIIHTVKKKGLTEKQYFPQKDLYKHFTTIRKPNKQSVFGKRPNVVIIILESFSREFIGYDNKESFTPFLDSLINIGVFFPNSFANGKQSIEAVPAILASIPSLMEHPFIASQYQQNSFEGLGTLVKRTGYHTSFFHGANNGSFNFDSFTKAAGFDNYFGRTEYNNNEDFDYYWGIWDEPFFKYTATQLSTFPQPFCSALFSISSHQPFLIPEKYKGKLKKGDHPLCETINYTDIALREFFKTAEKQPWYNNTIFIITADHVGPCVDPYYLTSAGRYKVPLLIYKNNIKPHVDSTLVQHIDIMPYVLDITGYPDNFSAFGSSILSPEKPRYAYQYLGGIYQIIDGQYLLTFDGNKTIGLFKYKEDQSLQINLINKDIAAQKRLENQLKAVIQTYTHSLIHNKLVIH